MATKTDKYQVGLNATNTQNFTVKTGADGTLRIMRGAMDAELSEVLRIDASGNLSIAGNLLSGAFGVGQTWQDILGSRSLGVTYTNTTGKPIALCVQGGPTSAAFVGLSVNINGAATVLGPYAPSASYTATFAIIPAGATYQVTAINGTAPLTFWRELR